jgi:hypothetical protein
MATNGKNDMFRAESKKTEVDDRKEDKKAMDKGAKSSRQVGVVTLTLDL